MLRGVRYPGAQWIQVNVSHAGEQGFFGFEGLRCESGFPELARTFIFEIGLAGNGLVQAAHEPADAGKPCPPDIDNVGHGGTFKGFEIPRNRKQIKEPVQLDLFVPYEYGHDFKVIVSNKELGARSLLTFHNGRGTQEGLFAELKSQAQLGYVPTRRQVGNQVYVLAAMIAHNLNRELQMIANKRDRHTTGRRAPLWRFSQLGTLRRQLIQRAGRLTLP
jgi:hypothetical protein